MKLTKRAMGVSPSLTLQMTAKAAKMKSDGIDVVSFGAGEPDFNTPKFISDAAKEALDKGVTRYTAASGTPQLRKAVCDTLQKQQGLSYTPAQIVVSNGAKHSLYNAMAALVEDGDEVIIPAPFWLTYPELVSLCDGTPVLVDTRECDFKLTPKLLKKHITANTKAILLNNPCNPTGVIYTKEEIYALAEELEKYPDIYIISDEIYDMLSYEGEIVSIATYSPQIKERTILINGVSKTYAMTGWRIGYSASNTQLAKAMGDIQSHATSNPNSIAQYATVAALTDERGNEFLKEMNATFDARRRLMMEILDGYKMRYIRPGGAFYVMIDISRFIGRVYNGVEITKAQDIAEILLDEKHVVVIPCEAFGAPDFIRLSYAASDNDIKRGLNRIKEFFDLLS